MSDNLPAGYHEPEHDTFECSECHDDFTEVQLGDFENGWCVDCTAAYEESERTRYSKHFGQIKGDREGNRRRLEVMGG